MNDLVISGWKFVPSKFVRPPKEFRIYGNTVRQTVLENFLIPIVMSDSKVVVKKKKMYQPCITKFFK